MKNEYSIALEICGLEENNIFLNIPADFNSLEPLLKTNKEFSSKTNYTFCSKLDSLPFKNQSVLSLASLHHFSNSGTKFFNNDLELKYGLLWK